MAQGGAGGAGGGTAPIAGAAALGAVVVAATVAFVMLREPDTPPSPADGAAPPAASMPAETAGDGDAAPEPPAGPASAPETVAPPEDPPVAAEATPPAGDAPDTAEATPDLAEAAPEMAEAAPDAPPPVVPPRFDLVRVDGTGSAVIAGQAGAGASVTLKIDGDPVEMVEADPGGNFVAMLALAPSETPRILSLEAAGPDGAAVPGAETVIIAPFAAEAVAAAEEPAPPRALPVPPPEPPPALRTDRPGVGEVGDAVPDRPADVADPGRAGIGAPPAGAEAGDAPDADTATVRPEAPPDASPTAPVATAPSDPAEAPAAADAPPAAPAAAPEAPAVLMAGADGVRVLQAPGAAPSALTEIQLDAITYDLEGDVTLAGRGPADASIRVTLNNQPINMGEIGPGGQWSLGLPDVDPGTYTLRLEQLAADGTVTRTVETPFLREDPARIRDNPMLVDPGASVITVQRGFTLWGIAEANFGEGILYVQIFEENRGEIRDPDLIFPGQIFALPDLPRVERGE